MSTKVSYKGAQIAQVDTQQTKTLLTAGKYCEDDFTLANDDNPRAGDNDVIFIDYDGTICYSYSASEFLELAALPPVLPDKSFADRGWTWTLKSQEWNWNLADAKEYVGKYGMIVIGQLREPSDHATHFITEVFESAGGEISFEVKQITANTIRVNWGDGSQTETSASTGDFYFTHQYAAAGIYDIAVFFTANVGNQFQPNGFGTGMFRLYHLREAYLGQYAKAYYFFQAMKKLRHISFWNGYSHTGQNEFTDNASLEAAVLPSTDNLNAQDFRECVRMRYISLPKNLTINSVQATFYQCKSLEKITLPETVVSFSPYALQQATAIQDITIPDAVTSLNIYTLSDMRSVQRLILPSSLTNINSAGSISGAPYLMELIFNSTSPPAIGASNSVQLPSNNYVSTKIYVPFSALADYLTATNYPNPATYTYIGFAAYASGATLPTQDGTAAYNVTWYATKGDAIAQTNAITEGNGKEIYCRYTAVA